MKFIRSKISIALISLLLVSCGNQNIQTLTETEETSLIESTQSPPTLIPPSPTPQATSTLVIVTQGSWIEVSRMRQSRSEMPAVLLNGKIYIISGLTTNAGLTTQKTSEVFDISSGQWESMKALPRPRHHGMAVALDGAIYYFGGSESASLDGTTDAWNYDPSTDQWNELAPLPLPRSAGAAVVYKGSIYILGGVGKSHFTDGGEDNGETLRYDTTTNTWTKLKPPLTRREHTAGALIGDQIYLFGGRWDKEFDTSEIYDPVSDTWRQGPVMPHPHAGYGIAVLNNLVYLIGGEVWLSGPEETLAWVDVFDPVSATWSSIPDLPVALHGNPAVASDETIYVIGGSTVAATAKNTNTLMAFRP